MGIHAEANKRYYEEHKKQIRVRVRRRRGQRTLEVISHYSDGKLECACCGEKHLEFLTIDHIEGGGYKHREFLGRRGDSFYRWLQQQSYPEGYQVLCYNCNCGKRVLGYCPHQREK